MKYCLAILMIFTFVNAGFADHFLGGEISYRYIESVGNSNRYEIVLNFIANCDEPLFDPTFLVIRTGTGFPDFTFHDIFLDSIYQKTPLENPCLDIPNVCHEYLRYAGEFTLPQINSTYHIIARNCCNSDLTNLIDDNNYGALYYTGIKETAFELKNSNPVIDTEVPTFLCVGETYAFNIGAQDVDGDQLVYELCAPNIFDSADVPGIPPLPPYNFSPYIFPTFSSQDPMGGDALELNPNTGELIVTPSLVGTFLIAVCIKEYRNGQLIGEVKRDFVLTASECAPLVNAKVESNETINFNEFIINECDELELTIENLSTDTNHIQSYYWNINNTTYTEWSPTIQFDEFGTFSGELILNPDEQCSDTANLTINLSSLTTDFSFSYDTCISGPVRFDNNSFLFGSNNLQYHWEFGDSSHSEEIAPLKYYQTPGLFDVSLVGINEFGCMDSSVYQVDWRPAPAILIVSPETAADCAPLSTTFNNLSWPIDSTYSFSWDFGDGSVASNNMSPSHEYLQVGNYDVTISVESPIGCYVDTVFQDLIIVEAPPVANFDFNPMQLSQFNSTIDLIDYSERAVNWQWFFDDMDNSLIQEPTYTFADTGLHTIQLIVQDFYGCADTLLQIVDVVPEVTYFLPNAFSPNGDGNNDVFQAKGFVDAMLSFEMMIFDRWGSVLFSTTDPDFEWRGIDQQSGRVVPKGVYVYQVNYTTNRGRQHQENGYVTIVK